jgi:hypothetical protein
MVAAAVIAAGVVAAAGSVAGSTISAGAAGDAADAQVGASRDANATQLQMFNQTRDDLLPYREFGKDALQRLYMLGASDGASPGKYPQYTPTPAYDPTANPYSPVEAYTGPTEAELRADPGYQFRVSEGQKALERSAAGKGLLLSGGQLKDLTRFGQDMGAQEYGAAYARGYAKNQDLYTRNLATNELQYGRGYQQNADLYGRNLEAYQTHYNTFLGLRKNQYGELAGLAGAGQGAVNTLGSLGQQTGQQLAQTTIGAGNARAAGAVGTANAINAGVSGVAGAANQYANYQLLSSLINRNRGVGAYGNYESAPQTVDVYV